MTDTQLLKNFEQDLSGIVADVRPFYEDRKTHLWGRENYHLGGFFMGTPLTECGLPLYQGMLDFKWNLRIKARRVTCRKCRRLRKKANRFRRSRMRWPGDLHEER